MIGIITGVLLSAVPHVLVMALGASAACADEADGKQHVYVVQGTVEAGGEDGKPIVIRTDDGRNMVWTSAAAAGDQDGRSDAKHGVVRIERKVNADEADQGWLGVMVSNTKADDSAGAAQVTITKVLEGSPAEAAGMHDGDVVVSIDGEPVEGDVSRSVQLIKSHEAGDTVDIVVRRDGTEESLVATLGSRADAGAATFNWTFGKDVQGAIEDSIVTRGKMLKRDENGNWVVTELGDLSEIPDLPDNIRMLVPEAGSRVIELQGDGDNRTLTININRDDETVSIKQEDGGDIVVTRVDADGNETVSTYADEDELKDADEEAYDLYNSVGTGRSLHFFGDASDLDDEDFLVGDDDTYVFKFDKGDFEDHMLEWKEKLEQSLADADEHYEEALKSVESLLEQLDEGKGLPALERLHKFRPLPAPDFDGMQTFTMHLGKPQYSFEVRPDGTIAATLRKGDTEVVQLFSDEDDLANRKPELYQKYKSLMDSK